MPAADAKTEQPSGNIVGNDDADQKIEVASVAKPAPTYDLETGTAATDDAIPVALSGEKATSVGDIPALPKGASDDLLAAAQINDPVHGIDEARAAVPLTGQPMPPASVVNPVTEGLTVQSPAAAAKAVTGAKIEPPSETGTLIKAAAGGDAERLAGPGALLSAADVPDKMVLPESDLIKDAGIVNEAKVDTKIAAALDLRATPTAAAKVASASKDVL